MISKRLLISCSLIVLFSFLSGCQSEKKVAEKQEYPRWVGDIEQNEHIDELDFIICNGDDNILQYFNLGEGPVYSGEKSSILNTFRSNYKPLPEKDQNGFIRIRFVVNCEGKTGRFRTLQSDDNFQETEFNKKIVSQLVDITKEIEDWKVLYRGDIPVDYYMYLIFKISEGQLTEILP